MEAWYKFRLTRLIENNGPRYWTGRLTSNQVKIKVAEEQE